MTSREALRSTLLRAAAAARDDDAPEELLRHLSDALRWSLLLPPEPLSSDTRDLMARCCERAVSRAHAYACAWRAVVTARHLRRALNLLSAW